MNAWFTRRRAERRKRHAESLRTQEMLFAKEVDYRRGHGMPVPDYLLPIDTDCQQCGHRPTPNDPATPGELPANLDRRDIGLAWTVRSDRRRYTWIGDHYAIGHYCHA